MFESSREKLELYFYRLKESGELTDEAQHTLQELRGRLRQLAFAYTRLQDLTADLLREANGDVSFIQVYCETADPEADPGRIAHLDAQPQDEVIVYLEYFYYSAHRAMDLINDGRSFLPGLTRVKVRGIREARNYLIEHIGKDQGNRVFSYSLSKSGPRLRPLRWSKYSSSSKDEGLWVNARELEKKLDASFDSGLESTQVE